jgi:hypothetical protein
LWQSRSNFNKETKNLLQMDFCIRWQIIIKCFEIRIGCLLFIFKVNKQPIIWLELGLQSDKLPLILLYYALFSCCISHINHNQTMLSFVQPSSCNPFIGWLLSFSVLFSPLWLQYSNLHHVRLFSQSCFLTLDNLKIAVGCKTHNIGHKTHDAGYTTHNATGHTTHNMTYLLSFRHGCHFMPGWMTHYAISISNK